MSIFAPPPNWKSYPSEEFHFSVDCPYPLAFTQKEVTHGKVAAGKWLTGRAALPDTLFMVNASSYISSDRKMALKSQLVVDNYLKSLNKTINRKLQYKITPFVCSGRPATLLTGSYEYVYDPVHFSNLIVIRPGQLINVVVVYGDEQRYGVMADQIIKSVKLDAQTK